MLAPTDYEITEAEDGEQALEEIAKHRPQDRQGTRHHGATRAHRPRRRVDRIATLFAAVRMSLIGTKLTSPRYQRMSALRAKAERGVRPQDVCS